MRLQEEIKTNILVARWYDQIKTRAENILQEPPSQFVIPDGLRLLDTSRRVLDRVYTLALVYRITRDTRFSDRAWAELDAAGRFANWNSSKHFLDTAEMTHAFAIGYDWLYDVWTPEQRAFLRAAIIDKGLKTGLEALRKKGWATAHHNWNQVCNAGLSLGALAIADEAPKIAGEVLNRSLNSIQFSMSEFRPDGGWNEGPDYWSYATYYNVTLLAALESALGTDFGLSTMPGFSETGFFPIYMDGPVGESFNFADSGTKNVRGPQLFWLARKFNHPEYSVFQRETSKPTAQDLIWFDPRGDSNTLQSLPLDRYYRGVEAVSFRSQWQSTKAFFAALKTGDNGVNHGHLDLGSFVFDALGQRWATHLGGDNYNLPDYFDKQRWTYYRLRAEGHNTLVLNPKTDPDQAVNAKTRIIRFQSRPDRAFAIADLTPAYRKNAKQVLRGICFLNRNELLIQDEVKTDKPVDLWWFMHTSAEINCMGNTALLRLGDKQMTARILSPPGATFESMEAAPLPSSPHPENQNSNKDYRKLAIHLPQAQNLQLVVLLTPGTEIRPQNPILPLSKW